MFGSEDAAAEEEDIARGSPDFTLKRAALEAKRDQGGIAECWTPSPLFDRLGLSIEMRRLQSQASERMSRMLRYEGHVRDHDSRRCLRTRAAASGALSRWIRTTGRIPIQVPIEGHLYELTLKQAEDLYQQGQR